MEFQPIHQPRSYYHGERQSFTVNIPFYSNFLDQLDLFVSNVKCPFTLVLNDHLSIPPSIMFKETKVVTLCPLISLSRIHTVDEFQENRVDTLCSSTSSTQTFEENLSFGRLSKDIILNFGHLVKDLVTGSAPPSSSSLSPSLERFEVNRDRSPMMLFWNSLHLGFHHLHSA